MTELHHDLLSLLQSHEVYTEKEQGETLSAGGVKHDGLSQLGFADRGNDRQGTSVLHDNLIKSILVTSSK